MRGAIGRRRLFGRHVAMFFQSTLGGDNDDDDNNDDDSCIIDRRVCARSPLGLGVSFFDNVVGCTSCVIVSPLSSSSKFVVAHLSFILLFSVLGMTPHVLTNSAALVFLSKSPLRKTRVCFFVSLPNNMHSRPCLSLQCKVDLPWFVPEPFVKRICKIACSKTWYVSTS